MLSFMLQIEIKAGFEGRALESLSAIQRAAHRDAGCHNFVWMRRQDDPRQFTLFEQWESKAALDAHLATHPVWDAFVPCLQGDPISHEFDLVTALLGGGITEADTRGFADDWFDKLSRHVPVDQLLPDLAEAGLRLKFPEQTITSRDEFVAWYDQVGEQFDDQSHEIERFALRSTPDGAQVDVVVVWRAVRRDDRTALAMRATQSWLLGNTGVDGRPVIIEYDVRSLVDIQGDQAAHDPHGVAAEPRNVVAS